MPLVAVKRWIKSRPWGLYLVEKRKKRLYTACLERYADREMIEKLYRRANHGLSPDLEHPTTFTEKLQWLKLYYRDPLMTICSDKYLVKEYLAEQGLAELVIPTVAVYDDIREFDEKTLPGRCMIKATHGSGWNIRVDGKSPIAWKAMKKIMAVWLSESAYLFGREWNYRDQQPRIMVEPLIADVPPVDYKLMCFNGVVRAVQVNHRIDGKEYADFYDDNWCRMKDMRIGVLPSSDAVLPRPAQWERMKEIATELSRPFPFVRVDLYEVNDRVLFGEMTFFPGSGFWTITPLKCNEQFGGWLTLPLQNHR